MMNSEGLKKLKMMMPPISMFEDCLHLYIYTPSHAHEGSNLPVMVWIHGGVLVVGTASMFDGSMLTATEDVVVVTIQYRLGVLGFFSTGDQPARGNWGYLDQVATLCWVQQNIAHFGGNPDLVTIFGSYAPVYFYEFQHQSSFLKSSRPPHVKADHGDEVPFVFGPFFFGMKTDLTEEEELLNKRMMKYWANFARHGHPNSEGLPYWPTLDHDEQYLQLDIKPTVG